MQTMLMLKKGMMLVGADILFFTRQCRVYAGGNSQKGDYGLSARRCPINQLVN
nr:hypothetical protein [Escherichia coli]